MMDCEQARDEFAALLDGELGPEERGTVEAHLSQCSDCLRELDGLKRVDTAYRGLAPVAAPEDFERRVQAALRPGLLVRLHRGRARRPLWPVLASAAAVLLVAGAVAVQMMARDRSAFQLAATDLAVEESAPSLMKMEAQERTMAAEGAVADFAAPPSPSRMAAPAPAAAPLPEAPADDALAFDAPAPMALPEPRVLLRMGADAGPVPDMAERAPTSFSYDGEGPAALPAPPALEAERSGMAHDAAGQAQEGLGLNGGGLGGRGGGGLGAGGAVERAEESGQGAAAVPRKAADRTFVLQEGVWRQEGYAGEETVAVTRDSETFRALLARYPVLGDLVAVGDRVVFRADDRWYELTPQ